MKLVGGYEKHEERPWLGKEATAKKHRGVLATGTAMKGS